MHLVFFFFSLQNNANCCKLNAARVSQINTCQCVELEPRSRDGGEGISVAASRQRALLNLAED